MQILLNSLNVLQNNGEMIAVLLLAIGWGSVIMLAALRHSASRDTGDVELAALALAGWPLPLLLAAGLHFLLARLLPLNTAGAVIIGIVILSAALSLRLLWGKVSPRILFPLLPFLLFAFLRLGYVNDVLLPQYFDSAFHYDFIQSILKMEAGAPLAWPVQGWYHPGYHLITAGLTSFLTAGLASLTGGGIARVMLLFGQLILAALPLPLYPLVRRLVGNPSGGWLAVTVAAFAWSMPAHAVDWGKYPALLGLLVLEFALGAALTGARKMGVLAALTLPILHTRALILLGIALLAWLASRVQRNSRWLLLSALALLAVEVLWLLRDPVSASALEPYLAWATLLVVALAAIALRDLRVSALACLLALTGMLAALLIPLTPSLTLLDRPLVSMALFLPLALFAGLGSVRLRRGAAAFAMALVILSSFKIANFTPSECCRLVGRDDVAALDWMDSHLPPDALIGIAGADLQISAEGEPLRLAGTDAGIWVEPLTGRPVKVLPYSTDLRSAEAQLCEAQVDYLYVGGRLLSFTPPPSDAYPPVFTLPGARIVQVACGGP